MAAPPLACYSAIRNPKSAIGSRLCRRHLQRQQADALGPFGRGVGADVQFRPGALLRDGQFRLEAAVADDGLAPGPDEAVGAPVGGPLDPVAVGALPPGP